MKNKKVLGVILIIIALAISVVSYFILPDMVTIQINFKGEASNVVSKYIAILVCLSITVVGIFQRFFLKNEDETKKTKHLILIILGYLMSFLTIIFNL